MSRESAAVSAVGLALGMGLGGLMMFSKDQRFKDRHGCYNCEYQELSVLAGRCNRCKAQRGSKWAKQEPKPVYCECCGAEKQ